MPPKHIESLYLRAISHGGACWYVTQRHGGRASDHWHTVAGGPYSVIVRHYRQLLAKARQGGLRLVGPDGSVLESWSAPSLRTRW